VRIRFGLRERLSNGADLITAIHARHRHVGRIAAGPARDMGRDSGERPHDASFTELHDDPTAGNGAEGDRDEQQFRREVHPPQDETVLSRRDAKVGR
jgi:hypothetical protein